MQVALDDYAWAAGIATELANTGPEVWHGVDHLSEPDALVVFAEHHGDPASRPRPPRVEGPNPLADLARRAGPTELAAVRALRTEVRALIEQPVDLVARASALTTPAAGATLLDAPTRTRWALTVPPDATVADALGVVCGVGVLGVVHALGVERFRPCGSSTCAGVFVDTTRPGRRRYCMPGLCGNRENVAAHRARKRDSADPR